MDGSDSLRRAGNLEVHVAEVVLHALDVGQRYVTALFAHDKPDRYSGHRRLDRDSGVHERERTGADRRHRGRAVRAKALPNDPYGVGELILAWDDRGQRPLGKRAVSYLAPARRANRTRFAGGERREVVMQQEPFELFRTQVVDLLRVADGSERAYTEHLGLAPCEQPGAMWAREQSDLAGDRTNIGQATAIRAFPRLQDPVLECGLQRLFECGSERLWVGVSSEFLSGCGLDFGDLLFAPVRAERQRVG